MTTTRRFNDDVTGKRLRLLIGLAVVLASGACGLNIWYAIWTSAPTPSVPTLLGLVAGVAVANQVKVYVRVRANLDVTTWGEAPVLVGLVIAPAPWVVLCAAFAIGMLKTVTRMAPQKAVFSVAKEVLTSSAAGAVMILSGIHPDLNRPEFNLSAIVVSYVALSLVDDLVFLPIMAVALGSPISQLARANWDIKLVGHLVRLATITMVIAVLALGGNLLILLVVPLVMACVHLWQSRRLATREERQSWQRLSQTIDELNIVELDVLLRSAATRAAQIFSADEAEIEFDRDDRLVRGTGEEVIYDGVRPAAPSQTGNPGATDPQPGKSVTTDLVVHDSNDRMGVLRLRFFGRITLNEFEQYKLKTFASALCTAIRNATAYAELERISDENAFAAMHDPLTGLANRRTLLERADDVIAGRHGGMAALLLLDLNHFKEVNDTLGHTAGDQVLTEVAARLRDAAQPSDLVARLGGDEFAILFTGLPTPAMAAHRADTLLACFDRSVEVDGMHLTVGACGGIALVPGSGGVVELMRRADVAMYQAKRAGQRTASYVHARDTADVGRLMLGGELSRAVAEHEFVVDFQPIVDLSSGEVVSAEALARWHHPQHGSLGPMRFLETVERSGQLPAFTDAVLAQSLTAVESWRAAGFDVPVAVNVSPRSLLDPRFPDQVLERLTTAAVSADRLVLALTETLTISQLEVVDRTLGELRDAGVRLALDDFGIGSSSLTVLSRIRVHELRTHRQFGQAVETSAEAAAVIRSTVDLARNLQLTVTAKGVQSEPQRHALWELGCVAGQGRLFARPMPSAQLLAALHRGAGGRPGALAAALHDAGSVVRLPVRGRTGGRGRTALPHSPS